MANVFNNNAFGSNNQGSNNNPFSSNNPTQQQNTNPFQSNNNNSNPFSSNQQPQNSMFPNNQQGGNIFAGNQQGNSFGSNQPQGNQGNNIFGNNQANQSGNIFGSSQNNSNIFGNNQANQGNQNSNMFGNNQQQSNSFAQNQQQNNVFSNQGNQGYGNQQNQVSANPFNNVSQPSQPYSSQNYQNQPNLMPGSIGQTGFNLTAIQVVANNNKVLEQQLKMMGTMLIQVEKCKLSETNEYKSIKVNSMPELKGGALTIRKHINQLKQHVRVIKNKRKQLEKEERTYIESTRDKLREYKEVLTQRLSQDSMIEGVREDINEISTEIQSFFKPMINAYKRQESINFIDPGDFELELVKKVSRKMDVIWDRVCEMQACQAADKSIDCSTIQTFEQLLEYFSNVSLLFKDFVRKYTDMKKELIQRSNRGSYEEVMRQVDKERIGSMGKGFKHYEILKNISSIIDEKQKKQKEFSYKTKEREKIRYYQ